MNWLLLTVFAILNRGSYGVLSKIMSRRLELSSSAQATLLAAVATPLALISSPLLGGISSQGVADNIVELLVMVVSISVGNILYFKGLKTMGAGLAQITFSSIILWGALLSTVLLDSAFTIVQVCGAIALMAAIAIAQYDGNVRLSKGVPYVLSAAFCFAFFQVISADMAADLTGGTYLLLSFVGPALLGALLGLPTLRKDLDQLKGIGLAVVRVTIPSAATAVGYYAFAFFAYREAPDPGVVVMLLTTQTILCVVLAMIFLNERHDIRRIAFAAVLAVAAAMAIKA